MTKIWRIKTCRVLVSLLAVALLVLLATTVSTNASAQETKLPFVRVEDKTVHRGQTFELNVYLEENQPFLIRPGNFFVRNGKIKKWVVSFGKMM